MDIKAILDRYSQWLVESNYDANYLFDDDIRKEIIDEFITDHKALVSPPAPEPPPKTRRAPRAFGRRTPKPRGDGPKPEVSLFVDSCENLISAIEMLPPECNAAMSWLKKVEGIRDWARDNNHATDAMREAVDNITDGVSRWD